MYFETMTDDILVKLRKIPNIRFTTDGRITADYQAMMYGPWVHAKLGYNRYCDVYFSTFFPAFRMVHSRCQECWKVVVRPRTLTELFKLHNIQFELGLPAKCGIENRPSVYGNYGGYFYNDSKEEGLQCYNIVRKLVDEKISPDVKVILKRGCTEFEVGEKGCGPSNKWKVSKKQKQIERIFNNMVKWDSYSLPQSDPAKLRAYRNWIEFAYDRGDETYLEHTGGNPLYPPYVTYHEEIKNGSQVNKQCNSTSCKPVGEGT